MFALVYFFISIAGLIYATYTDLKERLVQNKLNFAIAGTAITFKIFESIYTSSAEPILFSIFSGIIAFIFAYFLWKLGVWAGGDVKLLTAIGFANPFNLAILTNIVPIETNLFGTINFPVFTITLAIYSALMVFPLGIFMSLMALIKHPVALKKAFERVKEKSIGIGLTGLTIAGITIILETSKLDTFFLFPAIVILAFTPKKERIWVIGVIAIIGAVLSAETFAFNFAAITIPIILIYTFWRTYVESKEYAFREKINVNDLEEGMIPDEYIVEKNGKVEFVEGPSIKKVIKQLMDNKIEKALQNFKIEGRVISSPMQAGGIEEKEVKELQKMAKEGKIPHIIKVRKTMAFVPAILLAYFVLQLTGDFLWNVIL